MIIKIITDYYTICKNGIFSRILLCLKTAFSSFSPKICPNGLLFNRNYTFYDTHPSEPSVFTILSFKNTAFLGFQIFLPHSYREI